MIAGIRGGVQTDISTYFNQIDFDKLPKAFVMKCNHGCKWQYIIKDKEQYLNTPQLVEITKRQMAGWLEQEYFPWNGFEMQYKGIEPKILIEPLMRDEINTEPIKINVYCFNGIPKIYVKFFNNNKMKVWNEKFKPIDSIFILPEVNKKYEIDNINQTIDLYYQESEMKLMEEISILSKKLANKFSFVRVDWMIINGKILDFSYATSSHLLKYDTYQKIFFEELTFTPYSGFCIFKNRDNHINLGNWIDLEREKHAF